MNAHTLNTTLFPYTTLFRSSLQIKRLHPDAVLPVRAHSTDAGLDLHAAEDVGIPVLGRNLVPTGIAVQIPKGYVGYITPRSGLAASHGLTVLRSEERRGGTRSA